MTAVYLKLFLACGSASNIGLADTERHKSDSLIVRVLLNDGTTGYGEGCPRSYVTGENCLYASEFIHQISPSIKLNVVDIDTLNGWINANKRLPGLSLLN